MVRYANRGGNSGISGYEIGSNFIKIKFNGTARTYTYSHRRAGQSHVENMKTLAKNGSGLHAYVNSKVKNLYD